MAKANIEIETVTTKSVTLEMTEKEASVLAETLGYVSGYPNGTRGIMSEVRGALLAAGVVSAVEPVSGTIRFTDGSNQYSSNW